MKKSIYIVIPLLLLVLAVPFLTFAAENSNPRVQNLLQYIEVLKNQIEGMLQLIANLQMQITNLLMQISSLMDEVEELKLSCGQ